MKQNYELFYKIMFWYVRIFRERGIRPTKIDWLTLNCNFNFERVSVEDKEVFQLVRRILGGVKDTLLNNGLEVISVRFVGSTVEARMRCKFYEDFFLDLPFHVSNILIDEYCSFTLKVKYKERYLLNEPKDPRRDFPLRENY